MLGITIYSYRQLKLMELFESSLLVYFVVSAFIVVIICLEAARPIYATNVALVVIITKTHAVYVEIMI